MTDTAPATIETRKERKRRLACERQRRRRALVPGEIVVARLRIPADLADELPDADEGDRAAAILALIRLGVRQRDTA